MTHSLLIAVSFIFVFLAPVLYFNSIQKKKEKKKIHHLTNLARGYNLEPNIMEALPNLLLVLDIKARKLLTVETLHGEQARVLDLRNFNSCDLKTARSGSGGIDRIALSLRPIGNAGRFHEITIYNEAAEVHPNAERRLQTAEKWKQQLNEIVKAG